MAKINDRNYLDSLPFDAVIKIAEKLLFANREIHFDCAGHDDLPEYKKALMFCRESDTNRKAVQQALKCKLILSKCHDSSGAWIRELFGNNIVDLDLVNYYPDRMPDEFPSMPNLREAIIFGSKVQLKAISKCKELRSLKITNLEARTIPEIRFVIKTLKSLPVKKLGLSLHLPERGLPLLDSIWQKCLADSCPHVENFKLRDMRNRVTDFWALLINFRSLKVLTIFGIEDPYIVQEHRLPFFQSLRRLYLHCGVPVKWAAKVGAVVKGLSQHRSASKGSIENLIDLPLISELRLWLIPGAERALVSVPYCNVEVLSLVWGNKRSLSNTREIADRKAMKKLESWYQSGEGAQGDEDFYEPEEAVLLDIVRKAPNLKHLHLGQCRIKAGTVAKLLEIAGSSLEGFDISMDSKNESMVTQTISILNAISRYCCNIQDIWFERLGPYDPTVEDYENILTAWEKVLCRCPNVICSGRIIELPLESEDEEEEDDEED